MAVRESETKQKLDALLSDFKHFENDMREGTRQRREQDEQRIDALKVQISALEKMLNAEVLRRQEMNKSIQAWIEEQLEAQEERLHAQLKLEMEKVCVTLLCVALIALSLSISRGMASLSFRSSLSPLKFALSLLSSLPFSLFGF